MQLFLPFVVLMLLSLQVFAEEQIVFKSNNQVIKSVPLAEMKKLAPEQTLSVWEPHEDKNVTYQGYPLREVLDRVFGPSWKKSELVLFTCADGYKAPIPRVNIDTEKSLLAFARKDKADFSLNNRLQNEKNIPLGPLYLVWNNLNNPQIRAEEGTNWPYQIVGIELTNFATKFPHMAPAKTSPKAAQRGFVAFQKYCMSCHKVKGDGGDKGPELSGIAKRENYQAWLKQWIHKPSDLRPKTTMPALNKNIKNRDHVINDIIVYLKVMSEK